MRRLFHSVLIITLTPALALAQGRLIERPCDGPQIQQIPRCRPDQSCANPRPQCGAQLVRTSSEVKVALADRVLRYEVTETFRNNGGGIAEADYIFPLPPGAAFEDLKLSINGELVSGETMSADRARGIYEEIVRRKRDPALVEWMGSGMLRTRIFPINPGEEKKVVVRYQSVALREGDALRVDYRRGSDPNGSGTPRPMIDPRTVRDDRATRGDRSDRTEEGEWSTFSLMYQASPDYGDPYSPTHSLRVRDQGKMRAVDARGSASDITILLPLRRANSAALSVLTHAPNGERGFALITITPPAVSRRSTPRDLTFVVDVSGSMGGRKLEQAKAAGYSLLESLRPEDRFRIIDFSTDVREFHDGWTTATSDNIADARRYVRDLRAEGSTNISGALQQALERSATRGSRLPLVVLVTDGEPTVGERNPDAIAALAARLRGDARLFSVGVSADVNAALIEQLAVEGHGTAQFVRDGESVERAVSFLARRLTSPVLTNVRLRADGVRLSQLLPSGPIDLFAGQDLILLARYEGDGDATLRLEGESVDGPVTWTTRARFAEHDRANPFVARLWASQRVGWLAAEKRRNGGTAELDGEIRSLGEKYGIPTEFSSYLVVEPGMQVANASAPLRRDAPNLQSVVTTGAAGAVEKRMAKDRGAAAADAIASPAPVASPREMRFEAARASAAQRDAKSLAVLDSLSKN
ncbi:MAG: VIT domain-containing protein, partial [Gemmatimonadaceae bacterium]